MQRPVLPQRLKSALHMTARDCTTQVGMNTCKRTRGSGDRIDTSPADMAALTLSGDGESGGVRRGGGEVDERGGGRLPSDEVELQGTA